MGRQRGSGEDAPLWIPDPGRVARANLTAFIKQIQQQKPVGAHEVTDFASLYRWSVERPDAFWPEVWRFCGVIADERPGRLPWDDVVIGLDRMAPPDPALGPRWFPGARLNFAENLLRYRDAQPALVFWNEQGRQRELSYAELHEEVARVAAALRQQGIVPGDRVAGFMPNLPETVIAMLATTSLGAVWSSCSPDFGANGVLDRFGQIRPRVLFCADGYRYAGKEIDSLARVREVRDKIPEIERVVVVPYLRPTAGNQCDQGRGPLGSTAPRPSRPESTRAASLRIRPPGLHHVFVGNHRAAQVHGARRRWHAAPASQGTGAAHRSPARGPHLLLHHLRLDDVELAGIEPRGRGNRDLV